MRARMRGSVDGAKPRPQVGWGTGIVGGTEPCPGGTRALSEAANGSARRLCEVEVELLSHGEPLTRDRVDVATLFAEHHLGLVRLALLMVGDQATAEDVVQEAFARTHAGGPPARSPAHADLHPFGGAQRLSFRAAPPGGEGVPAGRAVRAAVWSAEHAALLGGGAPRGAPRPARAAEATAGGADAALLPRPVRAWRSPKPWGSARGTARSTIARGLAALARVLGEES